MLGSINLSNFVLHPFTSKAEIDYERLREVTRISIIGLNEVLYEGIPLHPLKEQRDAANNFRQIGLGVMGLADLLIKMGVEYGSAESRKLSDTLGSFIRDEAIKESVALVEQYGVYPRFDFSVVSQSNYFKALPIDLQEMIEEKGMANSHLLSIAPTGSISTLFGISGGIEPIFANSFTRTTKSLSTEGDVEYKVYTRIIKDLMESQGLEDEAELPDYCITSHELDPIDRVLFQSVWQEYVDSAISSTVNLKEETTVEDIKEIYIAAHKHGLKGITVFRDGCQRIGILNVDSPEKDTKTLSEEACST